jgi:hypothetical protein
VGQESWWDLYGSAVVLAVAAITAAVVAASVAIWSHRRQLAHDRDLRNREDVLNTIDSAVVSANEGRNTLDLFIAGIETIEERRDEEREPSSGLLAKTNELRDEGVSRIQAMRAAQVRLEIRFSKTGLVAETHKTALLAYNEFFIKALGGTNSQREKGVREGDEARENAATQAFEEFQAACRHWIKQ